jgi:large subunit ribosomal protein L5
MATKEVARLKTRYEKEIRPSLLERFGYSSLMQAPEIEKITLNMGVGDGKQDSKVIDAATEQLATIAGQRPSVRRARKSIANFKLREGMPVGVSVTLRGERSYEFLDRLMSVAIPRIRDFRGMNPRSFDGRGNYSMGVREQIIFPEIDYDADRPGSWPRHHDHDQRQERRRGIRAARCLRLPVRTARGSRGAGGRARRRGAGTGGATPMSSPPRSASRGSRSWRRRSPRSSPSS